jgi:hypothetical protein
MGSMQSEERRQAPRHGLARLAKIQLDSGMQPLYCLVTDISDGGVRVHANGFHVPDEFRLLMTGDGPFQNGDYRVIWRLGEEVGAKLLRVT